MKRDTLRICKQCATPYPHFGATVRLCHDCWLPYARAQTKAWGERNPEKREAIKRTWARKEWKLYTLYIAEHPEQKRRFLPDQAQLRQAHIRECARAYLKEHPTIGKSIGSARV